MSTSSDPVIRLYQQRCIRLEADNARLEARVTEAERLLAIWYAHPDQPNSGKVDRETKLFLDVSEPT